MARQSSAFLIMPCGVLAAVLMACAAQGPGYSETTSDAALVGSDQFRIVFLRPKDKDDGANGGRALIRVNNERAGAIAYGGFFFVDVATGTHSLKASGLFPVLGECEIQLEAVAGSMAYVDVGPRMSYMIAGTLGSMVGGVVGAAASPASVSTVGEAVIGGTAEVAAGAAAGGATAVAIESPGKNCRGPYKLGLLEEQEALRRLEGLALSQ